MSIVAFDVDGTLIDADDKPRADVIEKLVEHARRGDEVIVWSGGGVDYARRWVARLGIGKFVHRVVGKGFYWKEVDIAYDDQVVKLGKENILVGPGDHEERW